MKRVIAWTLVAVLLIAAGWYRWKSLHRNDYGYVLICAPNEKSESLAMGKYAYESSKLICAGLDGGFWLGTDLEELYKASYRIAQIIPEDDGVVYYMHKAGR